MRMNALILFAVLFFASTAFSSSTYTQRDTLTLPYCDPINFS
jgi:hypothetical protein